MQTHRHHTHTHTHVHGPLPGKPWAPLSTFHRRCWNRRSRKPVLTVWDSVKSSTLENNDIQTCTCIISLYRTESWQVISKINPIPVEQRCISEVLYPRFCSLSLRQRPAGVSLFTDMPHPPEERYCSTPARCHTRCQVPLSHARVFQVVHLALQGESCWILVAGGNCLSK